MMLPRPPRYFCCSRGKCFGLETTTAATHRNRPSPEGVPEEIPVGPMHGFLASFASRGREIIPCISDANRPARFILPELANESGLFVQSEDTEADDLFHFTNLRPSSASQPNVPVDQPRSFVAQQKSFVRKRKGFVRKRKGFASRRKRSSWKQNDAAGQRRSFVERQNPSASQPPRSAARRKPSAGELNDGAGQLQGFAWERRASGHRRQVLLIK